MTDHKALITLLNETKPVPVQATPRILRWALSLSTYEYEIKIRSTNDHNNADGLIRLPLPTQHVETPLTLGVLPMMLPFHT